ncbi:MaoC/PaaZ C-terminal domain-containing protein [Sinomonas notoginsengisoli]|uniref:MaoC/PaaZ C-terminal domain-containing protein n=1 Tax=Sinomonas notoginsengisoli TaxID=1457311 RepID=UPI001F33ADAA|nr:MaoC/PaaZ C-terminal domain-containing protein [Sinomonas notoginsengisoli]
MSAPARGSARGGIETVELPEVPSLSKLYVAAAAEAARLMISRGSGARRLPSAKHHVAVVRPDLAKLTEYQHLLGEAARDAMPAGYLHALAFPVAMGFMGREDFPLPLLGMVHLRNHVEYREPVTYNDLLDVTAWAENLCGHRAGTQVDVVAEVRRVGEAEPVWRGVSTYLAKGVFLPGVDKRGASEVREDFRPPLPTALWQLGSQTGRAYAAVSGDFNPIHLSSISARALGMRRSIAHGMYTASRALAEVGTVKGDSFVWDAKFEAPVFLPARVAVNITDIPDDEDAWERSEFVGWNSKSGRRHFVGSVSRLA